MSPPRFIVIYDGVCRLCDGVVKFILTRDTNGQHFRFCALQSTAAISLLSRHSITKEDALKSFILLDLEADEGQQVLRRSNAALAIASALPHPWKILGSMGFCIPLFIRDGLYNFIAENRYILFGKKNEEDNDNECLMPTKKVLARFLDADEIRESLQKQKKTM